MASEQKNPFGQYFTPQHFAKFMVSLLTIEKHELVLEPSAGAGVFLQCLEDAGYHNLVGYEVDPSLTQASKTSAVNGSFLSEEVKGTYAAVVGNPPYIRWKNLESHLKDELQSLDIWNSYFNSLCDYSLPFIAKSALSLKHGGELVFVTPEYWFHTTHAQKLRDLLLSLGHLESIFHFGEAKIFDGVSSSIVVFKFVRGKSSAPTNVYKYKGRSKIDKRITDLLITCGATDELFDCVKVGPLRPGRQWSLDDADTAQRLDELEQICFAQTKNGKKATLFEDKLPHTLGDVADIANGLVSGLDKAFQIPDEGLSDLEKAATVQVAKAKQLDGKIVTKTTPYLMPPVDLSEDEFQRDYPNFAAHLQPFSEDLSNRYSYNRDIKRWEWVFLRNWTRISSDAERILIPCKERPKANHSFRFTLSIAGAYATQDVTSIFLKPNVRESLTYVHAYLVSPIVTEWILARGVSRGGVYEFSERPIAAIPFLGINWDSELEVNLHNEIVSSWSSYLTTGKIVAKEQAIRCFEELLRSRTLNTAEQISSASHQTALLQMQ